MLQHTQCCFNICFNSKNRLMSLLTCFPSMMVGAETTNRNVEKLASIYTSIKLRAMCFTYFGIRQSKHHLLHTKHHCYYVWWLGYYSMRLTARLPSGNMHRECITQNWFATSENDQQTRLSDAAVSSSVLECQRFIFIHQNHKPNKQKEQIGPAT